MQFDYNQELVLGKPQLLLPDRLWRMRIPTDAGTSEHAEDVAIHANGVLTSTVSDTMMSRLASATSQDEEFLKVQRALETNKQLKVEWHLLHRNCLLYEA